jgi:hypothetical protein
LRADLVKNNYVIVVLILFGWIGCAEHGLSPEPPPPYGVAGVVTFANWPPVDSVRNLALVLFRNYPSGNLIDIVLDPQKARFFLGFAPYRADSVAFQFTISPSPPGWYEYVAVAQQYGPSLQQDWRIAGLYSSPEDTGRSALSLFVPGNDIVRGVNIRVDFDDPPPQP